MTTHKIIPLEGRWLLFAYNADASHGRRLRIAGDFETRAEAEAALARLAGSCTSASFNAPGLEKVRAVQ